MRIRHHPHTPAAVLLAGIAALYALLGGGVGVPQAPPRAAATVQTAQPSLPAPGTNERRNLDWCRHNVAIVHDIYWASACSVAAEEQQRRRDACSNARASGAVPPPDLACHLAIEPPDDSPECTLPDARALPLNTARAQAEQQCFDEATQAGQHAGRSN